MSDAAEAVDGARGVVPPSSHTPALSARASPTVNAILAGGVGGVRRPASARDSGPLAQVSAFDSRTARLKQSLGERGGGEVAEGAKPEMA